MDRKAVDSASVASVGYDDSTQTLEIEYTSGSVYEYFDVPVSVFVELMALATSGGSVGSYVSREIRGKYRYARM